MAKHVLKKPLKIQALHQFELEAGTEIEITDRTGPFGLGRPPMQCRVIIFDLHEYLVYQPDLDHALKD